MSSIVFIIFTFLIFFATLLCVNIFNVTKTKVQFSLTPMRDLFDFVKDLVAFDFRRKQNLSQQQKRYPITRFVKFGKTLNVTEEK